MTSKHDSSDDLEIFDAEAHPAPRKGIRQEDFMMRYFAQLRMFKGGIAKLAEASKAHGQVDKPTRARLAWRKSKQELIIIPAPANDLGALHVSWSAKQQSASMALRPFFLHYGIEMLKDSAWGLTAIVDDLPVHGKCVIIDLKHVSHDVEEQKRETGKPKTTGKRAKPTKAEGTEKVAAADDAERFGEA